MSLNELELDGGKEKLKYPFSVGFIVANELCERFNYYGMRTILSIYLVNVLFYSNEESKVIYHAFTMLAYFFPLFGAVLSDSFLGKFRTIFYVSMIYACGSVLLALASTDPLGLPKRVFSGVGLILIALGTGGIKPCVAAFGGDQFVLPQQQKHLERYFSFFYFSINAGSLVSTFLTPILRERVHCFGNDSCYPLAFGIPGLLMILSIVIFGIGKPLYKIKKPEGNIAVKVSRCMISAANEKFRTKEKKDHWLDHADSKYDKQFINDIKATLKVLVMYTPLPVFWALFDQQGTAWTFQAVRMNGKIGPYTILPDQMQVINPLLILVFIPLFSYFVYPALAKCNLIKTPLQKMVCGGFLAALAFGIASLISMELEKTDPQFPELGQSQLRLYNTLGCDITSIACKDLPDLKALKAGGYYENTNLNVTHSKTLNFEFSASCLQSTEGKIVIPEQKTWLAYFNEDGLTSFEDEITKSEKGLPLVRTLFSTTNKTKQINATFYYSDLNYSTNNSFVQHRLEMSPGTYHIENRTSIEIHLGGVYSVLVTTNQEGKVIQEHTIVVTQPNSLSMLLQLPQYVVITAAEIMFSITGLEFSYSQAPESMKAVLQAVWLFTSAVGNLFIIVIESAQPFQKDSLNSVLYGSLMVLDMFLFMYLATQYEYVSTDKSRRDSDNNIILESKSVEKEDLKIGATNPTFEKDHQA